MIWTLANKISWYSDGIFAVLEKQVKVGSKLSVLSIMGPEVKLMEEGGKELNIKYITTFKKYNIQNWEVSKNLKNFKIAENI